MSDGGSGWFSGYVMRRVGDGAETSFWFDRWLGDVPFCERFRRLFDLSENKAMTVADLLSVDSEQYNGGTCGGGGGGCGSGRRSC